MVNSLNKKWKELLYAFAGFGPNFLMVLLGAYFTDAINPSALGEKGEFMRFASGACFIMPALFPILYTIAKALDGVIDIPFAHVTDTLSTKWGRRRPAIMVCLLPMILAYAMCWIPIGGANGQALNTVWIISWALIFFATYTMCMIAYYGSLSTTCINEAQRLRVSGYKAFFDTISYCFVYALVPLILGGIKIHINDFVYLSLPLMLTLLIPLFMIKEGEKYGYPEREGAAEEKISIKESLSLTFKNKVYMRWQAVNCCTFFGLQMFLVSMNTLITGGMNMNGMEMALLNTCAFAPVPVMLYLFNKMKAKKGTRFTYQTCLIMFAVSIMGFFFGSTFILGTEQKTLQYIIGCTGSICGSWALGAFFMMPYLVPAQISGVEEKLTGKNHSAMYFAGNAVFTSIVSAISGSLIYEFIKNLFICKGTWGVKWATGKDAALVAAEKFGCSPAQVFNLGTLLVPFIVAAGCLLGAFIARKMPRDYTSEVVAKELKKIDSSIDLEKVKEIPEEKEDKGEILFVQIGLSVLSGFLFGFIWMAFLFNSIKQIAKKFYAGLSWVLCSIIPFASIFVTLKAFKAIKAKANELGVKTVGNKALFIAFGIVFPILPVNILSLAFLQKNINALHKAEGEKIENAEGVAL